MKNKTILLALSALLLASCNGGGSSQTPSQSSAGDSSQTTSAASEATSEATSEPASSSSQAPTSDAFNVYKASEMILNAANRYRETPLSVATLISEANKLFTLSSTTADSEQKLTEIDAIVLLYVAFKDVMPEHIGARSFQAITTDLSKLKLTGMTTTDPGYAAIKWIADLGILTTRTVGSLSNKKSLPKNYLGKYISRLHTYIGTSRNDDFFAFVNHDYLYDDNPYPHARPDGIAGQDMDGDGDIDDDDKENISDSNLIPISAINQWTKDRLDDMPAVKSYVSTYLDQTQRVKGVSAGLAAAIRRYLDAETVSDLITVLAEDLKNNGYCPLWGDFSIGNYQYTTGQKVVLAMATSYNFSSTDSIAPGSPAYRSSVERFTPIFQDIMGFDDEEALEWGTNYTHYKYLLKTNRPSTTDDYLIPKQDELLGPAEFNLYDFLKNAGVADPTSFYFTSKNDTATLLNLLTEENLPYIKGMFLWQMAQHYTICLPNEEAAMKWAYRPGYGNDTKTLNLDGQYYTYVVEQMGNAINNYFVDSDEFASETQGAIAILGDLKTAMNGRIQGETWLSNDGKAKAKSKLDDLAYSIGGQVSDNTKTKYPEAQIKSLEEGGTLFGNLAAVENVNNDIGFARVGSDWGNTGFKEYVASINPMTANAFYMPALNGICITLGYVAAYSGIATMDEEEKLASYGAVVGHELSHGFDSNGVLYDNHGEYKTDWFSQSDKDGYLARVMSIISHYDGYEIMPGCGTDGKTVQTEAIADVNGLHLCMDIAKATEGFDYNEFFVNYATNFGFYASQYTYKQYYSSDEHPVGRARVNTALSCLDEFHETYETKEGDEMYVAPEDRIVIW